MDTKLRENKKEIDIMVYGASGFTAKFIIKELMLTNLKIILAGRSKERIENNLKELKINCKYEIYEGEEAINKIKNVRLLMNCSGPFINSSENIVKRCIKDLTNYMDISGEPYFIKKIWSMNYEASKNNISIIPACGFDSVIADFGYLYFKKMLNSSKQFINNICISENSLIDLNNKKVTLNESDSISLKNKNKFFNITSVFQFNNTNINYGTWHSLIESFYNSALLKGIKKNELIKEIGGGLYNTKNNKKTPLKHVIYSNYTKSYWVSFMGSDISTVLHSQEFMKDPSRYAAYLEIGSKWNLFLFYLFFFPIMYLSRYVLFKKIFLKFYYFFSCGIVKKGINNNQINSSSFKCTFFKNHDFLINDSLENDILEIIGPDPGYKTTPIVFVECAKEFLNLENNNQNLVGVLTPSMIFKTNLIDTLNERGIKFMFK